ncbi:hypothetical protein LCGC14_0392190 [marine sediment metagenome]|uniref:DNA-directed DNA polymerase family A palm domain-containing protein n=1 Tax=marine sediment metagenome TaxID=412755 RepID=A0A0F9SZD8_9ZZZZ
MISGRVIAVDTETPGLNPWAGVRPFMFSFCNERLQTACVEFAVDPMTRQPKPKRKWLKAIRKVMENKHITKVFHNHKFDIRMILMGFGIETLGNVHDTMFMAHACKSNDLKGLKLLAVRYLGIDVDDETKLKKAVNTARRFGRRAGWNLDKDTQADYWAPTEVWRADPAYAKEKNIPRNVCRKYAVLDAVRTMKLFKMYSQWMDSNEQGAEQALCTYQRERKLWPVLNAIEEGGVSVNLKILRSKHRQATRLVKEIKTEFPGINLNPSDSLTRYFFGKKGLKLKSIKSTRTGRPSLDKDVLDYYAELKPKIKRIQDYRRLSKLIGTYLNNYNEHTYDGVLHPNFNQIGAPTGRFSSSNPPLQNVPNRDKEGWLYQARAPFGPRKGHLWAAYDYKQVEARIFAEEADEETMLKAFAEGRDVYAELAIVITDMTGMGTPRDLSIEDESKDDAFQEWRDTTKHNFLGCLYGMSKKLLAMRLGVELDAAYEILEALDTTFPRINGFMRDRMKEVKEHGHIITRYNRMLPIDPELNYKGVAYTCQSEAADLIKDAMVRLDRWIRHNSIDARIVLQIHDELVIEFHRKHYHKPFLRKIKALMEDNQGMFDVATPVDVSIIKESWAKPKGIEL